MPDETSSPAGALRDARWRLDGWVALVTGASSGLGARFARVLQQAGATALVTARRGQRLDEPASECGERIGVDPSFLTRVPRWTARERRSAE